MSLDGVELIYRLLYTCILPWTMPRIAEALSPDSGD
jgi:hypothetical protein